MKKTNVEDFDITISSNALFKSGLKSANSYFNFRRTSLEASSGMIIARNATGYSEGAFTGEPTNGKRRFGEAIP